MVSFGPVCHGTDRFATAAPTATPVITSLG